MAPRKLPKRILADPRYGRTPAVVLIDPKYGHNVAGALRSCSAFGARQLWVTGERAVSEWEARGRLPREERMKAYGDVEVVLCGRPLGAYEHTNTRIVAVEVQENAVPLTWFEHPDRAVYVFGPEDGSLGRVHKRLCTDFVIIPSDHCLNLATAVTLVLGHRRMSRQLAGEEEVRPSYATLDEQRGYVDSDKPLAWSQG